ncbi:HU family DNA-binding protein [Haliangium sp.]|uniref:HU family DNA-binding protein n=1 Tax=Haliangium sp. TaxID=2663208 RepID=UPI003D098067
MTKSELIEQVSELLKLPNGKAEQIVNCIFDSMVSALQQGGGIEIRGFGSFTVREYKAYDGRNPRTGETVHVAPKKLPFFKVGKDLRERVNGSEESEPGPRATSPAAGNGGRPASVEAEARGWGEETGGREHDGPGRDRELGERRGGDDDARQGLRLGGPASGVLSGSGWGSPDQGS